MRFAILLFAAACGATEVTDASTDALAVSIGPQSLTHGSGRQRFAFHGVAGDVIAPDAWPVLSLALEGPDRKALAAGAPRGSDPRHLAIDGFKLPKTGTYFVSVNGGGRFSLRLWMQSCHLPRQEGSQVRLELTPGPEVIAVLHDHARSPHAWTGAEIDRVIGEIREQRDPRVAISSAQNLLSALASSPDAQRARARTAAAERLGTPAQFRALPPQTQAFALWWLGGADALLFQSAAMPAPANAAETIAQLISAWPSAREQAGERNVQAKVLNGLVYGWQTDWTASIADKDGTMAWIDFATEWFDGRGGWLAELSAGAGEPDDD